MEERSLVWRGKKGKDGQGRSLAPIFRTPYPDCGERLSLQKPHKGGTVRAGVRKAISASGRNQPTIPYQKKRQNIAEKRKSHGKQERNEKVSIVIRWELGGARMGFP